MPTPAEPQSELPPTRQIPHGVTAPTLDTSASLSQASSSEAFAAKTPGQVRLKSVGNRELPAAELSTGVTVSMNMGANTRKGFEPSIDLIVHSHIPYLFSSPPKCFLCASSSSSSFGPRLTEDLSSEPSWIDGAVGSVFCEEVFRLFGVLLPPPLEGSRRNPSMTVTSVPSPGDAEPVDPMNACATYTLRSPARRPVRNFLFAPTTVRNDDQPYSIPHLALTTLIGLPTPSCCRMSMRLTRRYR